MLSASKSIMAVASIKRDVSRTSQQQKQVVNVNIQPQGLRPGFAESPQLSRSSNDPGLCPSTVHYPAPYEIDEGITVIPQPESQPQPRTSSLAQSARSREVKDENPYAQLDELQNLVKNNEVAVKALIMIIDILQSNPLIINKLIVAYSDSLKELIKTLTSADDVDIQLVDEVGCFASSKYNLIEDIYVINDNESVSLKYGYPDVMRLFDRFKISTKMIAVK